MINKILKGDCIEQMGLIETESVDLIYLDPPFFTEKKHTLKNRKRTKEFSFDDIWGSNKEYASFLKERILLMHYCLKETGSIFVHCDKSGEHAGSPLQPLNTFLVPNLWFNAIKLILGVLILKDIIQI